MHQKSGYVTVHVYRGWGVTAGVEPTRLDAETRVWSPRALMLRRGFGPSRLDAETRMLSLRV